MPAIRVAIIGGGSAYMPSLCQGFIAEKEHLAGSTLVLMDTNGDSLDLIARLCQRMAAAAGARYRFEATTDRRAAVVGADFVLTTFRPGGFEARRLDEHIPLRHGIIGQETVGPGGLFMAFRAIPQMLALARDVEELAPAATIVNYTNPTNMVTAAVTRYSKARIVGLCDGHADDLGMVANMLGVPVSHIDADWRGLNHATWTTSLQVDGRDLMPDLVAHLRRLREEQLLDNPMRRALWLCRLYGALPNRYMQYYYFHDEILAETLATGRTRTDEILADLPAIWASYQRAAEMAVPRLERLRGGNGHGEYSVRTIRALTQDTPETLIVNLPNRGALPGFAAETVVEVKARVSRHGIDPLPNEALPSAVLGLLAALEVYNDLAVEAAVTGSRDLALQALLAHPLTRSYRAAAALLDEMLAAHRAHLPQFA